MRLCANSISVVYIFMEVKAKTLFNRRKMAHLLNDFSSGPLEIYRKKATFDWKKMKIFLDTEEIIEYQNELYEELKHHPILFSKPSSLDEEKRISSLRIFILNSIKQLSPFSNLNNLPKLVTNLVTLFQLDSATYAKYILASMMFPGALQSLGTTRHTDNLDKATQLEILGAYCLTEIGHGSNAKCIQTTATYDAKTQEFILNTPNFEAAKCWAGLLSQLATHAVVYAQVRTSDGTNHSLHPFLVNIRDPKTMQPYAGVIVGDMGEKIGLNGLDNGFLIFKNYRIPRTCLLNKTGDVSEDGQYVTPHRNPNKRYGASLGVLSAGRVSITSVSASNAAHALSIAIRYAAVRKQFGPEDSEEVSILEYQSHQHRLIPFLSVAYVLKIFGKFLMTTHYGFIIDATFGTGSDGNLLTDLGIELHAVSSASKPVSSWVVRDAVQECREACAGHGYLKAAGIGDIRNDHDANSTYEGENHVLIQQTSNWLLKFWPPILQGQTISSPLKSIDFLTNCLEILKTRCVVDNVDDFITPNNICNMYQWLTCYLLKISYEKCENLMKLEKLDSFWAKNESQVYYCKTLAVAYIQHFMIQRMLTTICEATDPQIKSVLTRLLSLYGIWSLEKHISTFYQGGYASGPLFARLIQDSLLKLCKSLKNDAVALVDVIAPPDFLIKSVLGQSDGMVYKHLEAAMVQAPGALERPKWWKEIVQLKNNTKSKL
ncbi:hypothetical protein ILUMI_19959 [Ignelater luminosus]|uniref:Acyl-coenzyme A oxidase n=1 Tax=Ignelater luminosus TaxID=2038154 RepID=A0A8K0FZD6_IGNLU|nr:hypothetical protein ILUMI_19959 [Ignelater luminosus]